MELKDVTKNLRDQNSYRLEQRFKEMMRTNPRYRNLDKENQKLILDLISRERQKAMHGIKTSGYTIRQELYHLYQDRIKLGLTYHDLDQIKELLESFKE
ncbi:MAG: hypothetical protein HY931_00600 [Candidatus Falkowbacteria bacterium]|nr:MAG: hypothetical protein HY931_00600 [Candidatus Falkowbacteria bacterium]